MTTTNGITVSYIRSNEVYDIYHVIGNGFNEYVERPRNSGHSEDSVLNEFIN